MDDPAFGTVSVPRQKIEEWLDGLDDTPEEIEAEDRADYHWEVGSVDARLHAGEDVFMSDFERELYDRLAGIDGLTVVPQWPCRGKQIDLVATDHEGRRLAIEADGEQHHETTGGALIPEDIERQGLLEEAGWVFCRVRHSTFRANPDQEVGTLLEKLKAQPTNADLAARMRGELVLAEAAVIAEPGAIGETATPEPPSIDPTPSIDETADRERGAEPERIQGKPIPGSTEEQLESLLFPGEERDGLIEGIRLDAEQSHEQDWLLDDADYLLPAEGDTQRPGIGGATDDSIGFFADVPLRMVAMMVGALVTLRSSTEDVDLVDDFATYYRVEIPLNLRSLVVKSAWLAKDYRFVTFNGSSWAPGNEESSEIENFGPWTFNDVVASATALLRIKNENDVFAQLLHEVYATEREQVPRLVTSVVGKAVHAAQRG